MAKNRLKTHSIAAAFMLIIGGVLLPGGFFTNYYIKDTVANSIDIALLEIEDQGVPLIEEMVKDLGIPEALRGIRDQGTPTVQEMILQIGGAEVLCQIRDAALPIVGEMVLQMGVAEALTQINETAIPIVVEMVKQIGVAEVLSRINATAIPIVIEMVKQIGAAEVLSRIRQTALPIIEEMVNATFIATLVDTIFAGLDLDVTVSGLSANVVADPATSSEFFNDNSYEFDVNAVALGLITLNVFEISGVSTYTGAGDLTYSETARQKLLYGNNTDNPESPYYLPGVLQDIEAGSGVADFLELYEAAVTDMALRSSLVARYDADWQELTRFYNYLLHYLEAEMIPFIIAGTTISIIGINIDVDLLGTIMPSLMGATSTDDIANWVFYELWANGTAMGNVIYPSGIDFGEMVDGIPEGTTGFEVGVPIATGIKRSVAMDLWDEKDSLSFLQKNAMESWYNANSTPSVKATLRTHFGLTTNQINMILAWLWKGSDCFSQNLVPILIESDYGYGMPIEKFARVLLLEQWANGTIQNNVMYPGGIDFGDMVPGIPLGTTGFEVGVPTPTNIALPIAQALWDNTNPLSLLTMDGMKVWVEANTNTTISETLRIAFGLTTPQMKLILDWLWNDADCFSENLLPTLLESEYGYSMPITEFAQDLFMEIWANGTAFGEVMYPGGMDFGEMIEDLPLGTTGFEVGVPVPTQMTLDVVDALWNASYPYSLFNMDGIVFWFEANENDTVRDQLVSRFSLEEIQMDLILSWLWEGDNCFSRGLVPVLIESEMGYGMSVDELASLLFMEQWANGTILGEVMYPGGLDFGVMMEGLPLDSTGFEVGVPVPTGISAEICSELWDEENPLSLFNTDGMTLWYEANSSLETRELLKTTFGLTDLQMEMILAWLWNGVDCFSKKNVPILIESDAGYGMPMDEFALYLLLEQWANGTIMGDVMYEGGINFEDMMDSITEPLYGFEVGVPVPTGISYESVKKLYDDENEKALTNDDGIKIWVNAQDDEDEKADLIIEFGLTETQIDMILDWLFEKSFREDMVPVLMELPVEGGGRGMTLKELSRTILLEQWCNGTADGRLEYPYGFPLPLGEVEIFGFEIGYKDPDTRVESTGMSLKSAEALWDEDRDTSLVNKAGLKKWWKAESKPDSKSAKELQKENDLSDKAMEMLLEWLVSFRDNVMPYLAQYQYGLPADTTTLGNTLSIGGIFLGGLCIGMGTVLVKRNKTVKKQRAIQERSMDDFDKSGIGFRSDKYKAAHSPLKPLSGEITVEIEEEPEEEPEEKPEEKLEIAESPKNSAKLEIKPLETSRPKEMVPSGTITKLLKSDLPEETEGADASVPEKKPSFDNEAFSKLWRKARGFTDSSDEKKT